MRNHVLCALLLCSISLQAAEPAQPQEKTPPLSLCASFERFMAAFVELFKKETLVEGMESIEEMTANLLKTAFSIMGGNVEPALYKDNTRQLQFRDEQFEEMATLLVQHAQTISITRKTPSTQKPDSDDENQRKILTLFAGIVKNFFNIAQDPENRDNVLPNLMGMAAGIVEIGSEVIRSGDLAQDADAEMITAYVKRLDNATKQAMLNIILRKTEELWGSLREI
jgi:hypothetical protein